MAKEVYNETSHPRNMKKCKTKQLKPRETTRPSAYLPSKMIQDTKTDKRQG